MKTKFSLLALFGLSFAFGTAQQTIQVTPLSLAGWTVTGADRHSLAGLSGLSLPAGAQLARSFAANGLAVKFTTQPQIGTAAADWPVLEIGNAALVFTRDGAVGKLALVLGDQAPAELPVSFALDAEGRSVDPLTIKFAREGTAATVEVPGKKSTFVTELASGPRLEVVASAGATGSWTFDRLEVATQIADGIAPAGGAGPRDGGTANATTNFLDRKGDVGKPSAKIVPAGTTAGPDPTGGAVTPAVAAPKAGAITFEISTPPAVRRSRANVVRNAVANGLQK